MTEAVETEVSEVVGKHFVSEDDILSEAEFLARLADLRMHSEPVSFSTRVRRQLEAGMLTYVYDTDTDESSGPWGPWEQGT